MLIARFQRIRRLSHPSLLRQACGYGPRKVRIAWGGSGARSTGCGRGFDERPQAALDCAFWFGGLGCLSFAHSPATDLPPKGLQEEIGWV